MSNLLSFGFGYSARAFSLSLLAKGWFLAGTTRSADKIGSIQNSGVSPIVWPGSDLSETIDNATHLLISAPPSDDGDPVLGALRNEIQARASQFEWVGYLSTTGVYGNRDGGWVDESSTPSPTTHRGQLRLNAENAWQSISGLPLHIFRLAGIYGPERGPLAKVRAGTARRIIKPGQIFTRIHVEDIVQVLNASAANPDPGAIYNVCDNDPAPPQDVIALAAEMLGLPIPPEIDFADADLSPMARSFYAENKRVKNDRIKRDLGVNLKYPTYRDGLSALLTS